MEADMWDNTEPEDARDSAGFADPLTDFVIALAIGAVLGAIGFMLALAAGIRVPGLWG